MFETTLDVRLLPESDTARWQLLAPLVYKSEVAGQSIIVPAGFITDFVSFEPLKNIGQRAAVVQYWLYATGAVNRDLADSILKEALEETGIDFILANAMYDAVRLFGASHYMKEA